MLIELLKESIARIIGSALLSEENVEAVLKNTLAKYGMTEDEADKAVKEAKENLKKWRGQGTESAILVARGTAQRLMKLLNIPTRSEILELIERIDDTTKNLSDLKKEKKGKGD